MVASSPARPGNRTPSSIGRSLPAWRHTVGLEVAAAPYRRSVANHFFALAPESHIQRTAILFTDFPQERDFDRLVQAESLILPAFHAKSRIGPPKRALNPRSRLKGSHPVQ